MPFRNWRLRIHDILEAAEGIRTYTSGMNFDDFLRDQRTIDAVVRKLTITGEAAVHVPDSICELNPDIPWNDMRAMRNFVVHEYCGIIHCFLSIYRFGDIGFVKYRRIVQN